MSTKADRKKRNAKAVQAVVRQSEWHLVRNMYKEDLAEGLAHHKAHCTDPDCTDEIVESVKGEKVDAVLRAGDFKSIYIANTGGRSSVDWSPYLRFVLATGVEIARFFGKDGRLPCVCSSPDCSDANDEIILSPKCHGDGVRYLLTESGLLTLVCGDHACNNEVLRAKLATRPLYTPSVAVHLYDDGASSVNGLRSSREGVTNWYPAYLVCNCILAGAPPARFIPVSETDYGLILCGTCSQVELSKTSPKDFERKFTYLSERSLFERGQLPSESCVAQEVAQ
jgi:hypothetical protein